MRLLVHVCSTISCEKIIKDMCMYIEQYMMRAGYLLQWWHMVTPCATMYGSTMCHHSLRIVHPVSSAKVWSVEGFQGN